MNNLDMGRIATSTMHVTGPLPGQVQSIIGPSPPGGSFLNFLNITIPTAP